MGDDFKDQYNSPNWQRKRLDVLNERGFVCECCGSDKKQLHVHHKFYAKNKKVWEYDNSCLMVLCKDCHKLDHHLRDKLKMALSALDIPDILRVIGYISAIQYDKAVGDGSDYLLKIESEEESYGVSDYLKFRTAKEILEFAMNHGGMVFNRR